MKKFIVFTVIIIFISCNSSELSQDFNCKTSGYSNLESLTDFKKNFNIKLPKNWKTNYYYDNVMSSIYSADTTVSLTKTVLIDASFITSPIHIDANFIQKIKNDNTKMDLKEVSSKKITFLNKPSYYNLSEGKKGKYNYKILNIFTKADVGFLHLKTEVYGDSLVNERICKAINLINRISLN